MERIHHALYVQCREFGVSHSEVAWAGRDVSPSAAIIDSQSVKGAEKRGACNDPPDLNAGKKIKGKKRHLLVDNQDLLLHAIVHAAELQDRDDGVLLMATVFSLRPFLPRLYADGGYAGLQFQAGLRQVMRQIDVQIVKRSDTAKAFIVLPRR